MRISMKKIALIALWIGTASQGLFASPVPKLEIPQHGAYTGAYCDFGEGEDAVTYEALENFQQLTGKPMAIVAFGSFWGRGTFPSAQVEQVRAYGAVPLLFWSPWDEPYDEKAGPDKFALTQIIAGRWDSYIDQWADAAAKVPGQFFVSFACEMNGTWFPWSGWFYGKGPRDPVKPKKPQDSIPKVYNLTNSAMAKLAGNDDGPEMSWFGKGDIKNPATWEGPETFKKAWRHVVDRVRARGATNVLWVFQPNNYSDPPGYISWNQPAAYYPGPKYVDWLGLSVYGKQTNNQEDDQWCGFTKLLEWPYVEMCALDPDKPIMLAEWGVAESHRDGEDKGAWISEAFREMGNAVKYPRLKAALFWHERWQNSDGSYSNLRVNSSRASLKAYRDGVANPFWIGRPLWK
jgi:Glycosyl hydrolase family 26